jgi:hypothetical protein
MVDINTEKHKAYADLQDAAPMAAPDAPKPEMSRGEKIYNWVVYKGINYWVNLISSIAIADYFIHKGGKPKLDKGAEALGKMIASTGLVSAEKATHHATTALKTSALTSGGWGLLIPGTLAENNKRPIVHWLNDKLGVDQHAPDGHKETPDEIYIEQDQPHQTWRNAAIRDRKNSALMPSEDDHHGGKAVVERFVVNNVNKAARKILPEGSALLRENGLAQRWLGLAALDTFFTIITAKVMHATNGTKKVRMPHEIGDDFDPPGNDLTPNEITLDPVATAPPLRSDDIIRDKARAALLKKQPATAAEQIVASRSQRETAAALS